MNKFFRICRNILAVIGGITVLAVVIWQFAKPYFDLDIYPNRLGMMSDYVDSLRTSGPFAKDTTDFSFKIIQDTVQARQIKEYFQLDTLYAQDDDTWTKAVAIGKFVATHVPHANQRKWPDSVDAIGLWEYTKNVAPAFNCRLHGILTFELLLAAGIDARYVTCMPQDKDDNDCHVVNEVWLPELGKWAMVDSDMGGYYFTDLDGVPLSLREMREHYISGKKMNMYPGFGNVSTRKHDHYGYMAKNTYWFSCWGELSYFQENHSHTDVVREHYINLVPSGFEPFNVGGGNTITTDADKFWAAPQRHEAVIY